MEAINKGSIYIVSTPIGNLSDLSFRALHILKHVDHILCEDTRVSKVLFNHYQIETPYASYHDFNENQTSAAWLEEVKQGKSIAIISDAGTPLIADPGFTLIDSAIKHNIEIIPIGGSSALLYALVGSGLAPYPFYFHGFLPKKDQELKKILSSLMQIEATLIFYESPNRVYDTLVIMQTLYQERNFVVARELSKKFETFYRGNLKDISALNAKLKGECVILLEGFKKTKKALNADTIKQYESLIEKGIHFKDAIKILAEDHQVSKNSMYEFLKIKHNQ